MTAKGLAGAYLSTLGLTITNPATIISFAALAATLGLGAGGGLERPALVVAGVLIGSATSWVVLAFAVSRLRSHMTPGVVRGISVFSGLAIILLGELAIYSAIAG
jgi:threonine/homoserine/homoserine lactone efflux protein